MINEIRTWLANLSSEQILTDTPGSFYIDPLYQPRLLYNWMDELRSVLFGPNATADKVAYRVYQYMQIVHGCNMHEFVTQGDTRITYLPFNDQEFLDFPSYQVTPLGHTDELFIGGELIETNSTLYTSWILSRNDNELNITQTAGGQHQSTEIVTFVDELSEEIPFPNTGSTVRIHAGSPVAWEVKLKAAPKHDAALPLSQANAIIASNHAEKLFKGDDTLRRIWLGHPIALYRYAAMVIALARRTGEQQTGVN